MSSASPRVLVIPYPARPCNSFTGVFPMFSQACYQSYICQLRNERLLESLDEKNYIDEKIHLVSIPDGQELGEKGKGNAKLIKKSMQLLPGKLEELIQGIHGREDEKISCVIAYALIGWAIELAAKMTIRPGCSLHFASSITGVFVQYPKAD
ncbi:UDP-glycosyltransferase 83A1-like [Melia azedarach]|uniref:UDP-glycosyltransferase 83A1-like n=1 Tax=Melia azedarach TaxID=155640 RepID=A0ACC1XAM2_MELAZ|nr:UDP-glycosyltransferase 83A1-like [Melia azedarach]